MPADDNVTDIDRMDDREFEYFVADLWRRQGYDAQTTQRSGDGGVDIVADDGEERLAIEAKWRSYGTIGPDYVRQIAGVANRAGYDRGIVVTNQDFSDAAYREANQMSVKLVSGEQVRQIDERTSRNSYTQGSGSGRGLLSVVGSSLLYILEEPERLIDVLRLLFILFIGYLLIDAFGRVLGFNLPGGV